MSEDITDLKDVNIDDSNLDDWLYRKIKIHGDFISHENIFVFTHLSDPRGKFGVQDIGCLILLNLTKEI